MSSSAIDPLMMEECESCNNEWSKLCSMRGVTNVDLDDDKIYKTSPKWKPNGIQPHPTKDKKMKPVIHTVALIGTGIICVVKAETIGMKLVDILRAVIKHL